MERLIALIVSTSGDSSIKPLMISVIALIDPSGLFCPINSEALRPLKFTISVKISGTLVPPNDDTCV